MRAIMQVRTAQGAIAWAIVLMGLSIDSLEFLYGRKGYQGARIWQAHSFHSSL